MIDGDKLHDAEVTIRLAAIHFQDGIPSHLDDAYAKRLTKAIRTFMAYAGDLQKQNSDFAKEQQFGKSWEEDLKARLQEIDRQELEKAEERRSHRL